MPHAAQYRLLDDAGFVLETFTGDDDPAAERTARRLSVRHLRTDSWSGAKGGFMLERDAGGVWVLVLAWAPA